MTRLLLHAGTHKTGTTSIQEILAARRGWLRRRGVLYPGGAGFLGPRRPHHRFAHGLVHQGSKDHAASLAWLDAVRERARGLETVVISSEPVYRHVDGHDAHGFAACPDYWDRRRRYLERLAATLGGFEVEALLFFRRRDDFVASFVADLRRLGRYAGGESEFRADFAPMLDYDRQIDLFEAVFGKVTILDYDLCRDRGGSVPPFFETLGLPPPPGARDVWTRRRPEGAAATP